MNRFLIINLIYIQNYFICIIQNYSYNFFLFMFLFKFKILINNETDTVIIIMIIMIIMIIIINASINSILPIIESYITH